MNVLLTCAGRRSDLVAILRDAVDGRGNVVACDASLDTPAMRAADRARVTPLVDDVAYVDALLDICREEQIGALFSLADYEISLLARAEAEFAAVGTALMFPRSEVVERCIDKLAAQRFLSAAGIGTPATYDRLDAALDAVERGTLAFPLVVKSRWGAASFGIDRARDEQELRLVWELGQLRMQRDVQRPIPGLRRFMANHRHATAETPLLLIQETIEGPEYGIDVLNDLAGRHVSTFTRHKLQVQGSEANRAVTIDSPELRRFGATLAGVVGHTGNLNCDVISSDRGLVVLDLNPRIGASYQYSERAGARIPASLIAWASGEEPDPAWLASRAGVEMVRLDAYEVLADPNDD